MLIERMPEVQRLSSEEKLRLAAELWGEIEGKQDEIAVDESVYALLEKRFADHQNDPASAVTWQDFKSRIGK
jgi:putative addiction module component (TIGR02574 family)